MLHIWLVETELNFQFLKQSQCHITHCLTRNFFIENETGIIFNVERTLQAKFWNQNLDGILSDEKNVAIFFCFFVSEKYVKTLFFNEIFQKIL